MRRFFIFTLLFASILSSCNTREKDSDNADTNDRRTEKSDTISKITEHGIVAGKMYMDIVALQNDGTPIALHDLVGKTEYVLVDFWASWCGPCRRLLPTLKEIYVAQPEGKLQILGVSCDEDAEAWQKAVAEEKLTWLQVRDQGEAPYNPCDIYGVEYIPTTILIDAAGMIVARNPSEDEIKDILSN